MDEHGATVGIDVPMIQAMVGANVKVQVGGTTSDTITFTGPETVSFGFIVDEIDYDGARWSLQGAAPSGAATFGIGADDGGGTGVGEGPSPLLLGTGCQIQI